MYNSSLIGQAKDKVFFSLVDMWSQKDYSYSTFSNSLSPGKGYSICKTLEFKKDKKFWPFTQEDTMVTPCLENKYL